MRRGLVAVAGAVAVLGIGASVALLGGGDGASADDEGAAAGPATATAVVERTDLVEREELDGTLGYGEPLYLAVLVQPSLAQTEGRTSGYRIGPRDLIEVRVFETQELNGSLRVSEDGQVKLPLVGNVTVAGLTETEAAQRIKGVLEEKALQRASVSVQVQEFRARPISVIGSVRQPGNLAFAGRWTLLEALTAAGGLDDSHGAFIHVLRRSENGLSDQVSIRTDELLVRADPRVNIPIYPGDLINVPGSVEVTVYCMGEVESPGAVTFKSSERISLLTVIARAGGLTDRASSKIAIKRTDANGKTAEIAADYKRILAGKASDIELQPGDVVVIKESFF